MSFNPYKPAADDAVARSLKVMKKFRGPRRDILREALDGLQHGQELICTFRSFRGIRERFVDRTGFKIRPGANIQIITRR